MTDQRQGNADMHLVKASRDQEGNITVLARVKGRPVVLKNVPLPFYKEVRHALDLIATNVFELEHLNSFSPFGIEWS